MLDFIDVCDMTTDEGEIRKVSFAVNEKKSIPNTIRLMGVLPHNTTVTFDKKNAQKMIDFCQKIVDSYD